MATDLEQKARAAVPKHEYFVEQQLARVRGRVRAQDAGKAFLAFLIFTLAYALGMALVDRAVELSPLVRLSAFGVFALVSAVLLGWMVLCLVRRVNPYYAARQLEQTLPDAKNSLVNWLDLRDQNLPPVIHQALGLRAARDVKKADPDEVVSAGPTWILGGVLTVLIVAILILFVMGPQQFLSLMERAFTPFREANIISATLIHLVEPENGQAVVPPGRSITFRAKIDGRVPAINQPDAPRLMWRYNQSEPFVGQALDKDADETWTWIMPADQVVNGGLWYKITAGDTETAEYQITVSAIPQVRGFDVAYHFRPYLHLEKKTAHYPAGFAGLKAPRGTEVTLRVRANCEIRRGALELRWTGDKTEQFVPADIAATDPTAMRFPKIVLDRPGFFRVTFVSRDGKTNIDRSDYPLEVFQDKKPHVELVKPGKDSELPANGTLPLEGFASDDHGVKSMTLRLRQERAGQLLEPKAYRPGKSFKLVDGKYPDFLEYKDFVALEKLKTARGEPFPLSKGMVLEYWLEAVDNSDYPEPNGNLGKSKIYKVTILDPEKDQKKQHQDRQNAAKQQKQHEQKQDKSIDQRNQSADQKNKSGKSDDQSSKQLDKQFDKQKKDTEKSANDIQKKLDKQNPGAGDKSNDQKNNPEKSNKEQKQPNKGQPDKKQPDNGQSDKKQPEPDKGQQPKEQQANGEKNGNGGAQPQAQPKGNKSDAKAPKPETKDSKKSPMENPGDAKNGGNDNGQKKSAEAKDDGQNKKNEEKKGGGGGQAKDGGNKDSNSGNPGAGKQEPDSGKEKTAQSETKPGPGKGQPQPGKTKPNAGSEGKVTEAKKGPVDSTEKTKGLAKGDEERVTKPGKRPDSGNPPQAKKGGPNQEKDFGAGKQKGAASEKKEPTLDDIARLAKDLKTGDPKAKDAAEKELSRICRECQNPNTRGAAQDALRQANKTPPMPNPAGDGNSAKTAKQAETEAPGKANDNQAKEGDPKKGKGNGEGEPGAKVSENPNKTGTKAGGSGGNLNNMGDDSKAKPAHQEFNKRGANLQLENWKKLLRATPEQRKQAGITDEQWKSFNKAVANYEKLLRQLEAKSANKNKLAGGNSQLPSTRPTQLKSASGQKVDPLDYSAALPPPEFRAAQERFTATKPGKKK